MADRTIYEVLADTNAAGPAGDGTQVFRFRREREALVFAAKSTCWGRPAEAKAARVPDHLAKRWGL